jgi:hypothetical protein
MLEYPLSLFSPFLIDFFGFIGMNGAEELSFFDSKNQ